MLSKRRQTNASFCLRDVQKQLNISMVLEFWSTYYSWQGVPEKEGEGNFWCSSNDMIVFFLT